MPVARFFILAALIVFFTALLGLCAFFIQVFFAVGF